MDDIPLEDAEDVRDLKLDLLEDLVGYLDDEEVLDDVLIESDLE